MTTFEAVQTLAQRSRRVARLAWVAGALVMAAAAVAVAWFLGALFGHLGGIVAGLIIAAVIGSVAGAVRFCTRMMLVPLRTRWIEELARAEGLDAKAIAASFTLDSW